LPHSIRYTPYQDKAFVNLKCKRIQCDEIWSFVYAKEKNCPDAKKEKGAGNCWTWTAICADSKLIPCWLVGKRDASYAYHFMRDLAGRLAHFDQFCGACQPRNADCPCAALPD